MPSVTPGSSTRKSPSIWLTPDSPRRSRPAPSGTRSPRGRPGSGRAGASGPGSPPAGCRRRRGPPTGPGRCRRPRSRCRRWRPRRGKTSLASEVGSSGRSNVRVMAVGGAPQSESGSGSVATIVKLGASTVSGVGARPWTITGPIGNPTGSSGPWPGSIATEGAAPAAPAGTNRRIVLPRCVAAGTFHGGGTRSIAGLVAGGRATRTPCEEVVRRGGAAGPFASDRALSAQSWRARSTRPRCAPARRHPCPGHSSPGTGMARRASAKLPSRWTRITNGSSMELADAWATKVGLAWAAATVAVGTSGTRSPTIRSSPRPRNRADADRAGARSRCRRPRGCGRPRAAGRDRGRVRLVIAGVVVAPGVGLIGGRAALVIAGVVVAPGRRGRDRGRSALVIAGVVVAPGVGLIGGRAAAAVGLLEHDGDGRGDRGPAGSSRS